MNPERWQEVETIYHAALERPEAERAAYLREACRGDHELLREVESLLGFDTRGEKLLAPPTAMSAGARPALAPGTRLGAFEVIGPLGAGGMGEVYRARDTRLDRTVALKVLPADVMRSPERRERFEREARAVSRLSHPHICTLYDVGREGDMDFLVMEFLEGEPLAERLKRGPLPLGEALRCAVQVAGALDLAHGQGVIHRDLKPANVVLTRSGAKLLDFGLAKLAPLGGAEDGPSDSHSPTEVRDVTREGTILGTAAYMSPEQARGGEVDARSDLFSLGVMLYESLTGRNPFRGPTVADTLGAILKDQPDSVASLCPGAPGELARLVERLLSKSRDDRPASAHVLLEELGRIGATPSPGGADADAAPDRSIAVLPFTNLSAEPDHEFFSDGLAEELITDLSSIKALRVISRASSRQLRGTDKGMREIGRLLGVRYALTGSARKSGNAIRVTAQLVDTATDAQLWAERFSGTLDDVFDVQERVSRAIVAALQVTLSSLEDARLAERPIRDARAYELYLKAQELVRRYGAPEDRVLALLDHATAIEGPALPLRALRCYVKIMQMRAGMRTDAEHLAEAEAEARALLAEAPEQAHGHALLGFIAYERGDLKGAVRGLSAALERDASDADARFFLGISLEAAGREAEALAVGLRFRELDPLSPMAGLLLGSAYWFVGRPQEGLEPQEFALTIDPDNPILHWALGYTHALLGNTSLARTHADWMRSSVPTMPYTMHLSALVLAMEGRRDEALTTLRALGSTTFDAHLTFHLSEAYALADELETANRLLADGVERGFHPYPYISTYCPFLAPLRGTAEFAQVARRAAERVAEFHASP